VELVSGVPASMQILMTGEGLPVKAEKVEEVLRTSGEVNIELMGFHTY
jgi:hypothetical protein